MLQLTRRIRLLTRRRTFTGVFLTALATAAGCGAADPVALDMVICEGKTGAECVAGSLDVTVQGLPSELNASVTVSGPNDFNLELTASRMIQLLPGEYTIAAEPVQGISVTYDPEQASQVVSVSGTGETDATVTYVEAQAPATP